MTVQLYNNDCIAQMALLKDASIDLLFCDLPYGETSCKWDCKIDLTLFWKEVNRICKINCPMFFTTTTRFGVELINSNPKNFRYDLVWVKSASVGFLNAKKMPMRKHEMIYVFYRKLPLYDLTSHSHKFLGHINTIKPNCYNECEPYDHIKYDPHLPNSVIKEELCIYDISKNCYGGGKEGRIKISKKKEDHSIKYDPPLPNSVIKTNLYSNNEEERTLYRNEAGLYEPPLPNSILEIKSQKGKHSTQKPTALIEWILKYYSKEGDTVLDPTMGSGSTGLACKTMKRNFIGIEKDEAIYKGATERLNL